MVPRADADEAQKDARVTRLHKLIVPRVTRRQRLPADGRVRRASWLSRPRVRCTSVASRALRTARGSLAGSHHSHGGHSRGLGASPYSLSRDPDDSATALPRPTPAPRADSRCLHPVLTRAPSCPPLDLPPRSRRDRRAGVMAVSPGVTFPSSSGQSPNPQLCSKSPPWAARGVGLGQLDLTCHVV